MKSIFNKIKLNNKIINIALFLAVFFLFLLFPEVTYAEESVFGDWIKSKLFIALAWIVYGFVWFIGLFFSYIASWLGSVAQWNHFIDVTAVTTGWVIVRDLCNMFFVLIILVIAFATILKYENYSVKKLLPKLLIMAVLINFSKTICGLIIDFAQVIMLTFVNGFSGGGINNLVTLLGVDKIVSMTQATSNPAITIDSLSLFGGLLAALFSAIIAFIVVLIMLVILIFRIVMLWIYVILSPIAFLASAFPAGAKYSQQWWSEFSKQVIIGPLLAFFIWLALSTAQVSSTEISKNAQLDDTFRSNIPSDVLGAETFQTYLITIALLIGGLIVTQQLGGMAGAAAGKGIGWIRSGALAPAVGARKLAKNVGGWGLDKVSGWTGVDLNVARGYKRLTAQMDKHKAERALSVRDKTLETAEKGGRIRGGLAHLSTGDLAWRSASNWYKEGLKPVRRAIMGGEWAVKEDKIKELKTAREQIWSKDESDKHEKKINETDKNIEKKEEELSKLSPGVLGSPEHKEYSKVSSELNAFKDEAKNLKERRDDMKGKVDDEKAKKTDSDIKKYTDRMEKYTIPGLTEARVLTQAEMEGEQGKIVAHIDNSQELGRILAEAIKNKQQGLVSAVAKKMTRVGDYNEAMKALNLGTGREGMLGFAKILQEQGGFTKQASLGLVGEMGNIAKNIKHFGAFGAVKMEHGKWTEASEDQYEAAKYAEMSKVQKQSFARDTNRLGLGHYEKKADDGDVWEHDEEHWVLDNSTIALFKDPSYAKHYDKTEGTANLSAIGHLARHTDRLEKNGATAVAAQVKGRENETEVDPMAAVRGVKK